MMPLALPSPTSAERSRTESVNMLRRQALERLYQRRKTVDNLIRSLEDYTEAKTHRGTVCVDISVARKLSSDFVQSQI
jgi:hypothetical protein